MAPKRRERSFSLRRQSTAEEWRQRWVRVEVRSFCSNTRWPCRVRGSGLLSVSSPAAGLPALGDALDTPKRVKY